MTAEVRTELVSIRCGEKCREKIGSVSIGELDPTNDLRLCRTPCLRSQSRESRRECASGYGCLDFRARENAPRLGLNRPGLIGGF
jgi:hypothetical protein